MDLLDVTMVDICLLKELTTILGKKDSLKYSALHQNPQLSD
jgi:hypothetical protein